MAENKKQTGKIKRRCFSVEERYRILQRLEAGARATDLAREFEVNKSTIATIKRRREEILQSKEILEFSDGNIKERKRFRGTESKPMEVELYDWVLKRKQDGLPVSGNHLQEKALSLSREKHGDGNFKASNGWLQRFKERRGLKVSSVQNEQKAANEFVHERFKKQLESAIDVTEDNLQYIYSCNETALFWRLLPTENFATMNEICSESSQKKELKDRITVMTCTNAAGTHKIPLYIIGKHKKPKSFPTINHLPVYYQNRDSVNLDRHLMMDWFVNVFIPDVKNEHNYEDNKDIKIILIMGKSHYPLTKEFNADFCNVIFLPASASLVKPLEGIIEQFKRHCRKSFLSEIFIKDNVDDINKALQSFTLYKTLKYCRRAWGRIPVQTIRDCWKQLIPFENAICILENVEIIGAHAFHCFLSKLPGYADISVDETENYLNCDDQYTASCSPQDSLKMLDDNDNESDLLKDLNDQSTSSNNSEFCTNKAFEGLQYFIDWYEREEDCSAVALETLDDLNHNLIDKIISKKYL